MPKDTLHKAEPDGRAVSPWQDRIVCILFTALLCCGFILFWALPDRASSEAENRALQTLPALSSGDGSIAEQIKADTFLDNLFSGAFATDFAKYCADQFPARDAFIAAKAYTELALLKGENNGVIPGKDGYLIAKPATVNETLATNAAVLASFAKTCGVPVTLAVAGRTVDVMQKALPALYDPGEANEAWAALDRALADSAPLMRCDILTPLQNAAAQGEYVACRTDHHWTTYGAYLAYRALMPAFGLEPQPLSAFTAETASDTFYGTTYSKAGTRFTRPDTLQYFRFAGDDGFTTAIAGTDLSFTGFYDRTYLEQKDKYSSFLGGNYGLVTVTKNGGEARPTLLLLKDSYAHALAPFLAQHFNLVLIDLRYYRFSVADYLAEHPVDRVLLLYNMDSLLTEKRLVLLEG